MLLIRFFKKKTVTSHAQKKEEIFIAELLKLPKKHKDLPKVKFPSGKNKPFLKCTFVFNSFFLQYFSSKKKYLFIRPKRISFCKEVSTRGSSCHIREIHTHFNLVIPHFVARVRFAALKLTQEKLKSGQKLLHRWPGNRKKRVLFSVFLFTTRLEGKERWSILKYRYI